MVYSYFGRLESHRIHQKMLTTFIYEKAWKMESHTLISLPLENSQIKSGMKNDPKTSFKYSTAALVTLELPSRQANFLKNLCYYFPVVHSVWKSQKKSHSTLRAKRATLTFWADKSSLKNPKNGQFWRVFENLKRSNSVTRKEKWSSSIIIFVHWINELHP